MKLIFVRHGQTDYNKNRIPQGQEIDVQLNVVGIKQIEEISNNLASNIDFIICSPLKRTYQTAQIINTKLNKNIEFNDKIKELKYGSLAGKTWSEIEAETGDNFIHDKDKNLSCDYIPYGGESGADLVNRVARFIDEIKEKYQDKIILVVTHGGVIDAMHLLFPQKEKTETKNATIHEFIF